MAAADSSIIPYYSKELKQRGVPKTELLKMITRIQEDERIKLGHELHDGVGPLLVAAKLYLEIVSEKSNAEKFVKDQAKSNILLAIENIRNISSQLVGSQKMQSNLPQLIAELADQISRITPFKINFKYSHENQLSQMCPNRKLALYRIVQEQLNNIIKHSKASCVEIKLYCKEEIAKLSIRDNGVGFDIMKKAAGIGLTNIQTRIRQLSGRVNLKSSPGKGCVLNISLSLLEI